MQAACPAAEGAAQRAAGGAGGQGPTGRALGVRLSEHGTTQSSCLSVAPNAARFSGQGAAQSSCLSAVPNGLQAGRGESTAAAAAAQERARQ